MPTALLRNRPQTDLRTPFTLDLGLLRCGSLGADNPGVANFGALSQIPLASDSARNPSQREKLVAKIDAFSQSSPALGLFVWTAIADAVFATSAKTV